ncbi:MAG TPA: hypothetical protein VH541_05040 [Gaiellaceae bacterium]
MPGESYLVLTLGLLSRKHHVLPAGAVKSVGDGAVYVVLSRSELGDLPLLSHPEAAVGDEQVQDAVRTFEVAASKWPQPW